MAFLNRHRQRIGITVIAIFLALFFDGETWAQNEVAGGIMDDFIAQTNSWWGILREKALGIFKIALVIDVCLFGFRMAMPGNDVGEIFKELVTLLVFAGFIALVIVNYENWSKSVAINGLTGIVGDLTDENFSVDKPFEIARRLWDKTYEVSNAVELSQLPRVMLYMVAVGFLIIAMFFLSAIMIMAKCEFYIVANVGVLLIGLGGSKIFKDYATNVMRYVLSIGVKIFVIQLLANVGLSMISLSNITGSAQVIEGDVTIAWSVIFTLIAKVLILLVLAKTLPDSCAGMLSGATVGGGNPMAAMAIGAGRTAMTMASAGAGYALGAAKTGVSAVGAVKDSYDVAKDRAKVSGTSGMMSMAKGMGGAFLEARSTAKTAQLQSSQGSMVSQLKSLGNMARAPKSPMPEQEAAAGAAAAPMSAPPAPETVGGGAGTSGSGSGSSFLPAGAPVPPSPLQPVEAAAPAATAAAPMSASLTPAAGGGGTGFSGSGPGSSFSAGTPVLPPPARPVNAAAPASTGPATPVAPGSPLSADKARAPISRVPVNQGMNLPPSPQEMAAMKPNSKTVDMRTPKVGD